MTTQEKRTIAFLSIAICWMFYLFSYITRVEPSVLVNDLMSEFGLTSSIFGFIVSVAYIPYVAMQIPCGIITDKLGTKTMVVMSCALCSLGTFIFGAAESVMQLEIGRFMIGLASASAYLCCCKVATDFFDRSKYAMLMGVAMCMGCFGGIAGTAPTALMVSKLGWRNATYVIAFIGLAITLLALIVMKQRKSKQTGDTRLLDGLKVISKNPRAWILGLYGAMTYLPLSALAELWVVPFMEQRFGITTEKAAISSIVIFIGVGLGSVISAAVAAKLNSYKKTIILFTIALIVAFWLAIYNDSIGYYTCLVLLLLGGTFAGANTLCFAVAYHMVPEEFAGTSAGFINALIMSSGILFQPLLGKLLDFFRNGLVTASGAPVYNLDMYRSAFMFVILALFIAVIATFFLGNVKHKQ